MQRKTEFSPKSRLQGSLTGMHLNKMPDSHAQWTGMGFLNENKAEEVSASSLSMLAWGMHLW